MAAEANVTVDEETDTEEFGLDDYTFPTEKQPQSYNDVSLSNPLISEQRAEVEALVEQYPDVQGVHKNYNTFYKSVFIFILQI